MSEAFQQYEKDFKTANNSVLAKVHTAPHSTSDDLVEIQKDFQFLKDVSNSFEMLIL